MQHKSQSISWLVFFHNNKNSVEQQPDKWKTFVINKNMKQNSSKKNYENLPWVLSKSIRNMQHSICCSSIVHQQEFFFWSCCLTWLYYFLLFCSVFFLPQIPAAKTLPKFLLNLLTATNLLCLNAHCTSVDMALECWLVVLWLLLQLNAFKDQRLKFHGIHVYA